MSASLRKLLTALRERGGQDWQALTAAYLKAKKLTPRQKAALGIEVYRVVFQEAVANLHIDEQEARNLAAIKDFFKIPDEDTRALRRSYGPEALQMMLDWFLVDDILTPSEQVQLFAFGEEMALTKDEVQALINASATKDDKKRPKPPQPIDDSRDAVL